MKRDLQIENLKCGGCATTITRSLDKLPGVSNVAVDVDHAKVSFDANDPAFELARTKLDQIG